MISFYPNCTLPATAGTFVAGANVRGTMDIIWSCVAILILSCWSILHQNIPPQFRPQSKLQSIRRELYLSFQKLKWVVTILMAPEIVLTKAILDYMSAKAFEKPLEQLAKADGVTWSLSHTFFANMGGFPICFPSADDNNPDEPESSVQTNLNLRSRPQEYGSHGQINCLSAENIMYAGVDPRNAQDTADGGNGLSTTDWSAQTGKETRPVKDKLKAQN